MIPKRGAFAIGLTAVALVLLLNFRTPSIEATATAGAGGGGTGATTDGGQRIITGPVVSTRWGPVQVEITLDGSSLMDVAALQLPDGDRRSAQISNRTEPVLRTQALAAQSAAIDGISGATYTSIAYARSLQAALDSAVTQTP